MKKITLKILFCLLVSTIANAQYANNDNVLICPFGSTPTAHPLANDYPVAGTIVPTSLDLDQSLPGVQSTVVVNGIQFNADPSGEVTWIGLGLGPNFVNYTFADDLGNLSNVGILNVYFDPAIIVSADYFSDYSPGDTTPSVLLNDNVVGSGSNAYFSGAVVSLPFYDPGFTMNTDGSIVIDPTTPPGNYTLTYRAYSPTCPYMNDASVTINIVPKLGLIMTGTYVDYNADGYTSVGDVINYQFTLSNTSITNIDNVDLTSPTGGIVGSTLPVLNGGSTNTTAFTSQYIITQNDINTNAIITKTVDATGTSATGISTSTATVSNSLLVTKGIKLNAFFDTNNNGVQNVGEVNVNMGQFSYEINSSGIVHTLTSSSGTHYLYESNPATTYNLGYTLDPGFATYYNLSVSSYPSVTVTAAGITTYNFPVIQGTPFDDLSVVVMPNGVAPRPGFTYSNRIKYTNLSNHTITSGTVSFNCGAAVSIISTVPSTSFTTNAFTYNFLNLLPFETRYINVTMQVPTIPTVALGAIVSNSASITLLPGDIHPADNTSNLNQTIVGSYDPNDKAESHGEEILFSSFTASDYLTYTIQFENTGTANAVNIRVNDILDSKLDETSINVIDASHAYVLDRVGATLNFKFDAIDLPPSVPSTTIGKGYVVFKIKPKPGFVLGDIIPNTASIYFDFNPPIITNTFHTKFVAPATPPTATFDGIIVCAVAGTLTGYPITANDLDATSTAVDASTVDLDPSTPEQDTSVTVNGLTFSVDSNGILSSNQPGLGNYGLTYTVKDSNGVLSNVANVSLYFQPNVLATNDDFSGSPINGLTGGTISTSVLDNDLVAGGSSIPLVALNNGFNPGLSFTISSTGYITIPAGTPAGMYTFYYEVKLAESSTSYCPGRTEQATIVVTGVAPTATIDLVVVCPNVPGGASNGLLNYNVVANDYDANFNPVNPSTVDLNPSVPGQQTSIMIDGAIISVDSFGIVTSNTLFSNSNSIYYTVKDMAGTESNVAEINVYFDRAYYPNNDDFSATPINGITGGNSPSIILNDGFLGTFTSPLLVNTFGMPFTINANKEVVVPPGTAPGNYNLIYELRDGADCPNNAAWITIVVTGTIYYADNDGDGFGNPSGPTVNVPTPGYVLDNTDCDDTQILYQDLDNDGLGSFIQAACGVDNTNDCDDTNALVNYYAFHRDVDGDGFGQSLLTLVCAPNATSPPPGYSLIAGDCNDNNPLSHSEFLFSVDNDGDGYGGGIQIYLCAASGTTPPPGFASNSLDCNDNNANINPGKPEICYNNIDDNCNGSNSEGCTPVVVNMTPSYNNTILPSFATAVPAVAYTYGAVTNLKYRFSIKNVTTNTTAPDIIQSSRYVTIPASIHLYGATYTIKVSAVINDEVVAFAGNTITLTAPSIQLITLAPASCGATLASLTSILTGNPGANATGYTLRIRLSSDNSLTPNYGYSPSSSRFVGANTFTGFPLTYGTSYKVAVEYTFTDPSTSQTVHSGYGAECTVVTPSIPKTTLASPTCGSQVGAMNAGITAAAASYATGYQFRIRMTSDNGPTPNYYYSVPNASRFSSLTAFQGITFAYNTQYSISVQYSILNNSATVWSDYGPECILKTPFFPTTSLVQSQCGLATPTSLSQQLNIIPYPGFPNYKVKLEENIGTEGTGPFEEKVFSYAYFRLNQFTLALPGKSYYVSVAVKQGAVFGNYTTSCDLFTPLSKGADLPFKATAYPNPFANNFMLDVKTNNNASVNLKVYDMIGRLIEQRDVSVSDIETTTIGDQYPSGIYNLVVSQDDNVETLRVVKR